MKASELIKELQKQMDKYGDLEFMRFDNIEDLYYVVNRLEIHCLSDHTKEDDNTEFDVFVLE